MKMAAIQASAISISACRCTALVKSPTDTANAAGSAPRKMMRPHHATVAPGATLGNIVRKRQPGLRRSASSCPINLPTILKPAKA